MPVPTNMPTGHFQSVPFKHKKTVNFLSMLYKAVPHFGANKLGAGHFGANIWAQRHFGASSFWCLDTLAPQTLWLMIHFGAGHFGAGYTLVWGHFGAIYTLVSRHFGARTVWRQSTQWLPKCKNLAWILAWSSAKS